MERALGRGGRSAAVVAREVYSHGTGRRMILTDRTWYREGDTARVSGFSSDGNAVVSHLDTVVRTVPVLDGEAEIPLEGLPLGGYGVTHETTQEQTAFDVLTSPFERPRYGFVTT